MASDEVKAQAQAEKELGTAAYKAKDFAKALEHYGKATEIDSTEMLYHLNISAVYLQMKDYDNAAKSGIKATEVGMDNGGSWTDYKTQGKAFGRVAKAYEGAGNLEQAERYYDKALVSHRDKIYLNGKRDVQKKLKEQKRLAYVDPEKAAAAKATGNEHFKAAKYPEAIKEYTEAIERNPDDAAFVSRIFSNRAACYTKLGAFPQALKDAEETIKSDPAFIKGYLRKANALKALQRWDDAIKAYDEAVAIDPQNAEASQGRGEVNRAKYGAQAGMTQEQRAEQAMKDPEIQSILQDPVMNQILQSMQSDPASVQDHLKNPEVLAKIMKLQEAGIIQMR